MPNPIEGARSDAPVKALKQEGVDGQSNMQGNRSQRRRRKDRWEWGVGVRWLYDGVAIRCGIMEWHKAAEIVRPHTVRISTPSGWGTGFFLFRSPWTNVFAVATAAHVVEEAYRWLQPIRVTRDGGSEEIVLRPEDRAVFLDAALDTAAIVFKNDLSFPKDPLPLMAEGRIKKVGVEIAWLGYPGVVREALCFFSGRVSAHMDNETAYLVDGVAINGVSGGPAICTIERLEEAGIELVGLVSAYIPNRATGAALPGVAVVRDVTHLHNLVKHFKSVDEAKKKETLPPEQPSAQPEPPIIQEPPK